MWSAAAVLFLSIGSWNVWIWFSGDQTADRLANLLAGCLCLFAGLALARVILEDDTEDLEEIA